jgi:hypothetical protein
MITIADALIFAMLAGIAGFLWFDRGRVELLEEENDELWDEIARLGEVVDNNAHALKAVVDASTEIKD